MEDAAPLKSRGVLVRLRGKYLLVAAVVLVAAAGLSTGMYFLLKSGGGESIRVVTAVQMPYPDGWSEQPLSEADVNAGLLVKLEKDRPEASFLARTVIAGLAPDFDINRLADDAEAALGAEIKNFDLLSRSVVSIGGFDAVRITYRQIEDVGSTAHQTLMTIVPTSNQTFYLTFRAEKTDFRRLEAEGSQITDTFVAYVAEALR